MPFGLVEATEPDIERGNGEMAKPLRAVYSLVLTPDPMIRIMTYASMTIELEPDFPII